MASTHLILASGLGSNISKIFGVIEAVAIFLAVILFLFFLVGRATGRLQRPLTIVICLGPAIILAFLGLVAPAINTAIVSLTNKQYNGQKFPKVKYVGLKNYEFAFTDPDTRAVLLRTLYWLIIVPIFAVGFGLLIAVLVERMKHSSVPKSLIFLPTAISFVGASLIWLFMYTYAAPGNPQTGLLSATVMKLGWKNPPNWLASSPLNMFLEMIILIWIQAGFAMIVLGAALNAIPDEVLEAARMDGATGFTLFRTVQVPMIRTTLVVVTTTVTVASLKTFDIVNTLNNGSFNTDVLSNRVFNLLFVQNRVGLGSALSVILFLLVLPLVGYNVWQIRKERAR
jgi:alpha-glucoside transport system permease protein